MYDTASLDEYRLLAEAIPQIIWVAAPDGRAEFFNAQWFAYTGLSYEEAVGDGWQHAMHAEDADRVIAQRSVTLETGDLFEAEFRLRGVDGVYRWFLARSVAMREPDGRIAKWFGSCTDIDARKRAHNMLRFFARAGGVLTESLDVHVIASSFIELLVPEFADYCQLFLFDESKKLELVASAFADPAQAELMQRIMAECPASEDSFLAGIVAARTPRIMEEITPATRAARARNAEHYRLLAELDTQSATAVPLIARGELIGVLLSAFTNSGRKHSEAEAPVVEELARRLGHALDNARRYQVEHEVATAFQHAMLPRALPDVPGVKLESLYIPASTELQVGGDWFDAFAIRGGLIGLSIGDVTGHGLDAAIVMGEMRQAIRSAAIESMGPSSVLDHADRVLQMNHPETVATAGFGVYDPSDRTLTYANAGHPAPLVVRPDGTIASIDVDGLLLGLRALGKCGTTTVVLEPGSLVCFYTDGLIEFNRDAVAGEEVLRAALATEKIRRSKNPAAALYHAIVVDGSHADDTAILSLYVE